VLIFVYLCLKAGLYAEMGINLFYFIMSVYGWIVWSRRDQNQKVIPISSCSRLYHLFNLVALTVCLLVLWWVLAFYTDSTVPVADALTTSLFLVAMWLMARKKIENWIYYIIGNLISIPMYAYKGLALSGIQFFVFLILAVMGYLEWKKRLACATQP
jgi:nicotinamide mononucleotide transporter